MIGLIEKKKFPELLKCNSYAVCLVKLCLTWLLKFELCILQTHMQYEMFISLSSIHFVQQATLNLEIHVLTDMEFMSFILALDFIVKL